MRIITKLPFLICALCIAPASFIACGGSSASTAGSRTVEPVEGSRNTGAAPTSTKPQIVEAVKSRTVASGGPVEAAPAEGSTPSEVVDSSDNSTGPQVQTVASMKEAAKRARAEAKQAKAAVKAAAAAAKQAELRADRAEQAAARFERMQQRSVRQAAREKRKAEHLASLELKQAERKRRLAEKKAEQERKRLEDLAHAEAKNKQATGDAQGRESPEAASKPKS